MTINQDISNLPTPPNRSDSPSDFSDKADTFLGALPTLQIELNLYADEVNSTQSAINTSESNAATSEQNAASSASAANVSENNAATSESNAAASESAAATSEAAAANSATAAATSEQNSANSETAAASSASAAAQSESNAASSASAAANSETSASNSAAEASQSASNASTSEQNAAQSASDAEGFADAAAALVNISAWDAGTTFNTNDAAIGSDGNSYRSLVDNNIGNDPVSDDGSNWLQLTSAGRDFILTPENVSPADGTNGTTLTPQLEASPYRSLYGVPMASAQWQIAEVQDFATTVVDETVAGTSTTFTPSSNLDTLTTYYWRVRYTDDDGNVSDFSDPTEFATANTFVDTPTISVSGSPDNITREPTISTSAFSVTNGSDTHISTDWEVIETATNNVVFESANDASNLTSIDLPAGTLDTDSEYKFRARHRGSSLGASGYGEVIETTADIFTDQPTITSPTDGETDIGETPTITSSAFNTVNGSDTHVASEWVITRVSDNVVVFDSGEDTSNLESIDVPAGVLDEGQESYTVKVRHKGQTFGFSAYSPEITFVTASVFFDYTDPANIGTSTNGGFLVGVIDTVAGTIDSQDDYQTGERYALIVAPKSLEDATNPQWDSQDRTGEAGSFTRWDGLSSTDSILAKNDTSYEAFEHIRSIRSSDPVPADGGSDWYLPAMDELELIYRNLKPVTADNSTFDSTRAFPGQQNSGFNPSSDPTGSAYTATGEPFQTSVTDFQDGGAEAVDLDRYWSSTDADEGGRAWRQIFSRSGTEGIQDGDGKDFTGRSVRPVRRVVL